MTQRQSDEMMWQAGCISSVAECQNTTHGEGLHQKLVPPYNYYTHTHAGLSLSHIKCIQAETKQVQSKVLLTGKYDTAVQSFI